MAMRLPKLDDGNKPLVSRPQTAKKITKEEKCLSTNDLPVTHRLRLQVMRDQYAFLYQETNWTDDRLKEMKRKYGLKFGLRDVEISGRWSIILEKCEKSVDPCTILSVWLSCCCQQIYIKDKLESQLQKEVDNYIKPLYFYKAIGRKARDDVAQFIIKNADEVTSMLGKYYKDTNDSLIANKEYMEMISQQVHEMLGDDSYEPMGDIETLYEEVKDSMCTVVGVIDSLKSSVKDKNKEISDLRCHITDRLKILQDERDEWKQKAESLQDAVDKAVEPAVKRALAPAMRQIDDMAKQMAKMSAQMQNMTNAKREDEPADPHLNKHYKDRKAKESGKDLKTKKSPKSNDM